MPALFRHITPETPTWIRGMYFDYLAVLLPQERFHYMLKDEERNEFYIRLEALDGGRELLRRCAGKLRAAEGPRVDLNQHQSPTEVQKFLQRTEAGPP